MFSQTVFSERLKGLRLSKNLKQEDIANLLKVTKTQISDIERGRRTTTIEKIVELAEFYGVSSDYLLGISDDPSRH